MEKTWFVKCPKLNDSVHQNGPSGWSLTPDELERIENDYYAQKLKCGGCGNSFSLWQGVRAFYVFSDILLADFLIHNAHEHGVEDIEIGKAVRVSFAEPFEDNPKIYLTPQFDTYVAPTGIGKQGFTILSCFGTTTQSRGKITWFASGRRGNEVIPIWRVLLSNAKEHQLAKNYRSEIVELESAFEVFISEYLSKQMKDKVRQGTIDWILNKRNIGEPLEIGFIELTGKPIEKLYPAEYKAWVKHVKEKRNDIVHRGLQATKKEAEDAQTALFDILTKIDISVLEHFQIGQIFINPKSELKTHDR